MLALLSVWLGLASLAGALAMTVHRRLFTDLCVTLTLYAAIFSLTFAGLTWWDLRRQPPADPGVAGRRMQLRAGTVLALCGATITYALIHFADVVPRSS
jgi:hypothetical protein